MAMNEWDRDYVEYLIQRDLLVRMSEEARERARIRDAYAYHWNVRLWESIDALSGDCPDCGSLLMFTRDDYADTMGDPRHVHEPGCPVAGSDMDQRLDDMLWVNSHKDDPDANGWRNPSYSEMVIYRILKPASQRDETDLFVHPLVEDGTLVRQLTII